MFHCKLIKIVTFLNMFLKIPLKFKITMKFIDKVISSTKFKFVLKMCKKMVGFMSLIKRHIFLYIYISLNKCNTYCKEHWLSRASL